MRFESKGDRIASEDALEVIDEILERAREKRLFVGNGMFTIRVVRIEDIEQISAELKKKYEVDVWEKYFFAVSAQWTTNG